MPLHGWDEVVTKVKAPGRPVAPTRTGVLAALAVCAVAVVLELAYGANVCEIVLYLGYESLFVITPGWLAYRALSSRPGGGLRQLAVGWALGYAIEILAFMLTAATDTRGLFVLYPLVVAGMALAVIRRRGGLQAPDPQLSLTTAQTWIVAAVCGLAIIYVGLAFFPFTPLPGPEPVRNFPDYSWAISIAAEAKHHWPIEDPNVSGEPFPYHYFAHIDLAAASQVTNIELPAIFFRLWLLPLIGLLTIQVISAGQTLLRHTAAGLIAACLVMFVGQLQLDTTDNLTAPIAFLGVFFTYLTASPTFVFGLIFFLPLIALIGERIAGPDADSRLGDWIVIGLLAIGASDAKVVVLPVIAAGLVAFGVWARVARRVVPRPLWIALGITVSVFAVVYLWQYRGHPSGLRVDLGFTFFTEMPAVALVKSDIMDALPNFPAEGAALTIAAIAFGAVGLLAAPLIGLAWILRRQGVRLEPSQAWLLALLGAGLAAIVGFNSPAANEFYFFFTALPAGCILSAGGLWNAWETRSPAPGWQDRALLLGATWVLALLAVMLIPPLFDLFTGPDALAHTYVFLFAGLALSLGVLYVLARRWTGPTRWTAAALVCAAVVLVGALDTPLQKVRPAVENGAASAGRAMSPQMYDALTWLRDTTTDDAVIAVNNQVNELGPYEFSYGAFSERRVFLGGWGYSAGESQRTDPDFSAASNPYPERLALNEAAFEQPSAEALAALRAYGVRYLVVDEVYGPPADLSSLGERASLVYEDSGVKVFELR